VLTYPAPERNKDPILDVLARVLPVSGRVLEIASGTGQHVVHFAQGLPRLLWQPSDYEAPHRAAIAQRIAAAARTNIQPPLELDVLERPWRVGEVDAVVCINMIHIAPWSAGVALIEESARLLPEGGVLFLYGPYRRSRVPTAPSNEAFDVSLRERNPEWGLRQLETVTDLCLRNGLEPQEIVEMPANNLSVVFRRGAGASGR
jgi:SAM-dependent methyltransferase